jgi:hypothetical protein
MQDSKNVVQPIQDWLLSRGKCVTCGRDLLLQKRKRLNGHYLVSCACRKHFLYDPKNFSFEKAYVPNLEIYLR